jgi:hypothetical protein
VPGFGHEQEGGGIEEAGLVADLGLVFAFVSVPPPSAPAKQRTRLIPGP